MKCMKRIGICLCVLMLLVASLSVALAEAGDIFLRRDGQNDPSIIRYRQRMVDYGFYGSFVPDSNAMQANELSDADIAALQELTRMNPQIISDPSQGVTYDVFWNVVDYEGRDLKTPNDKDFSDIPLGTTSEAVTKVQTRLKELKYNEEAGFGYTPGTYTEEMNKALAAFMRCNKSEFDSQNGLSASVQSMIFAESASPYNPEEAEEKSFSDKVFGFLKGSTNIAGLSVANAVLLILGFVIVAVIVFLIIKLVSPAKAGQKGASTRSFKSGSGVHFDIKYKSESFSYDTDLTKVVRIGRSTGAFPLSLEDESISRKHCEITKDSMGITLTDFSSNGTIVNGRMYNHGQCRLHSGDVIEVGKHTITIHF